ncbi:MAG: polysaccharide deacetylase family protein [Chloroflexota bacterium]
MLFKASPSLHFLAVAFAAGIAVFPLVAGSAAAAQPAPIANPGSPAVPRPHHVVITFPSRPAPAAHTPAPSARASSKPAALPNLTAHATILMYHHVAVPPADLPPSSATYFVPAARLDRQVFYLLTHGYAIVSLKRIVSALTGGPALPPKPVAITFDDGWQDFWQNGLAVVHKYSIPVTLFVIANGDTNSYMNPAERWALAHSGVDVEAHTLTHPFLTHLLPAVADNEIVGSRANLQKELSLPVPLFAYPYGDIDPAVMAMVKAAGYQAAFAATAWPEEDTANLYQLPRVLVSHYDTMDTFAHKVADYQWARTHVAPVPPEPTPTAYRPTAAPPSPVAGSRGQFDASYDPGTSPTRLLNGS